MNVKARILGVFLVVGLGQTVYGDIADVLQKSERTALRTINQEREEEFAFLEREIKRVGEGHFNLERLEAQAADSHSVYRKTDRTPADIVLRSSEALLDHLLKNAVADPKLHALKRELVNWKQRSANIDLSKREDVVSSFNALCAIRRKIIFLNPKLDFNRIIFLNHWHQRYGRGEIHMVDQYFGFNARKGGGLCILENPFSDSPRAYRILQDQPVANGRTQGKSLADGAFNSLELDYDAKKVYFGWTAAQSHKMDKSADWSTQRWPYHEISTRPSYMHYYWAPERVFHIHSADLQTGEVTRLTDGALNEYDPCVLPDGRIAFISERIDGNQRCGQRWAPTATLHAMEPDGSDIVPLSYHETNEWHPSVDNDGKLIYSRWDYVDRDNLVAHHVWECFPDGRDPRSYHGNYPLVREARPCAELSPRAIPSSNKIVAVAAPHHGLSYGSLVTIDRTVPDDGLMSQVKRITPEVRFPESEYAPGFHHEHRMSGDIHAAECYGSPWPIDETTFLCVYTREGKHHGLYLVDIFGNKELLWVDREMPVLDPMPLMPRKRPPVIPVLTHQSKKSRPTGEPAPVDGEVVVMNVYDAEHKVPDSVSVKWLRVVNIFPKSNAFMEQPKIGWVQEAIARGSLGIVPVEADGSVYFKMPAGVNVYFQLLDSNKCAVQTMRSATYVHPGEMLSCTGCHENKSSATPNPKTAMVAALKRPPSKLRREPSGSYPLTFPRLVQPVLDAKCVACHATEKRAPDLSTEVVSHGWTKSYERLSRFAWGRHGGNGTMMRRNGGSYSTPMQVGAYASKLYTKLAKGHHGVQLTDEEMLRITLWLDLNSVFYGAYDHTEAQAKGKRVLPRLGLPVNFAEYLH